MLLKRWNKIPGNILWISSEINSKQLLIYAPFPSAAGKSRRICPPLWRETAAIRVGAEILRKSVCRSRFTLVAPNDDTVSIYKTFIAPNDGMVLTRKTLVVPNDMMVSTCKTLVVPNDTMVLIHKSPIMPNEGTVLCLMVFGEWLFISE